MTVTDQQREERQKYAEKIASLSALLGGYSIRNYLHSLNIEVEPVSDEQFAEAQKQFGRIGKKSRALFSLSEASQINYEGIFNGIVDVFLKKKLFGKDFFAMLTNVMWIHTPPDMSEFVVIGYHSVLLEVAEIPNDDNPDKPIPYLGVCQINIMTDGRYLNGEITPEDGLEIPKDQVELLQQKVRSMMESVAKSGALEINTPIVMMEKRM